MRKECTVSTLRSRLDRRRFLGAASAAAGLAAAGRFAPARMSAQEKIHLALRHDVAIGPLLEPYVQDFNNRYPYDLGTSYPPQDYIATTQTQFAGGSVDFDVLFADEGLTQRWYDNGWIRKIDDLPGFADVMAEIPESLRSSLQVGDGSTVALPYYRGFEIFVYNAAHLDKISATPPKTWDEFVETCRKLKADGVTETPFSPFWTADFGLIWYEFMSEMISETTNPMFGDDLSAAFAADPVSTSTLTRWKTLYDEELVPKDIFTTPYGDIVNIFGGGQSTFTARYAPQVVGWRDPQQSTVADQVRNVVSPGATGATINFGANWVMAAATEHPNEAFDLMKYFGWKDIDGQYYFCKHFLALDLGLSTAYDAVNNDPEVKAKWATWADIDQLTDQLSRSRPLGPAVNQVWYRDLTDMGVPLVQDMARGAKDIAEGLAEIDAFVKEKIAG
jgi:ABC-type glycerol-3-phosphate transport system substrate-binding protein